MSSLKAQSLFIITLIQIFDKINHIEKIHLRNNSRDLITIEERLNVTIEWMHQTQKDTTKLGTVTT